MVLFYVITMAIAFTNMFSGKLLPFYIKYFIAAIWIVYWLYDIGIKRRWLLTKEKRALWHNCLPYFLIALWSFVVWLIDKPDHFSIFIVSRMLSNVVYICMTFVCGIAGAHFFGKRVIHLSVLSMGLSTMVNLLYAIASYGIGAFTEYIPDIFNTTNYVFGSKMYNFALSLETQDVAMATGFYLIYYVLFDTTDTFKAKLPYILICIFCAIIGFKRTTLFGLIVAASIVWLVRMKQTDFRYVIYMVGYGFICITLLFIVALKTNLVADIIRTINVDSTGRIVIYATLTKYYELSPIYLGKGFLYVDKSMYDSIGFVAHSVVAKMYAEIGCIPYLIWAYHFLIGVPIQIYRSVGVERSKVMFVSTVYLFTTFFIENTLSLFCVQYSFLLIPLAMSYSENEYRIRKRLFRLV